MAKMMDKMLAKTKSRAAGRKAPKAGKKSKGKSAIAVAVPVKIVRDDEEGGARPLSDYDKERAAEKKEHGGFDKYKVESACRTLEEAADILHDKKLMAAVAAYHEKKHKKIKTLAGLRAYSAQVADEE